MSARDRRELAGRLSAAVSDQLRQGVTPAALATTVALGLGLGVLPVPGTTTLLCGLLGAALRLNQPVLQLVNYLAWPLQLLLLIPFLQAGQRLFGEPPLGLAPAELQAELARGVLAVASRYAGAMLRGVVVWALVAPPVALLVRLLLLPPLRALLARGGGAGGSGPARP